MDCRTARLLLELAHPHAAEFDATEAERLHGHLAECGECGTYAREERRIDAHLAAAMQAVPVPSGLRERILAGMQAERVAPARPRRYRLWTGLAAAAAILLTLTTVWYLRPLTILNLQAIHGEPLPRTMQEVERHFAQRGAPTSVPTQFNYGLLLACQLVEFQGQARVPHLLFHREGHYAEVYILSAKQFNRDAAVEQPRVDSGGWTVEVHEHPDNPQVFYLIKYTSGSLQRFLMQGGISA